MTRATKLILLLLVISAGLSNQPLTAQESLLKDQVEAKRDRKYAFYPSTLRMINLKANEEYNKLVNGVEKLLVYTLDSTTRADKSYLTIPDTYLQNGFDEYASITGGELAMSICGKDGNRTQEYVGYFAREETVIAFYLRGSIPWQKIPILMKDMQDMDLLNFFDLKNESF